MNEAVSGAAPDGPVKFVLQRRARPGAQISFEAWIRELVASASREGTLQGSSVLTAGGGEYFILLRFASRAALQRWESAPEVRALVATGDALATAADTPQRRSGLETWFTLPGMPAPPSAPPAWKMALVTWCALLPQVMLLAVLIPAGLPFVVSIALSTAIPVAMLTWVIMPRATRLLYRWLYAPRAAAGVDGGKPA